MLVESTLAEMLMNAIAHNRIWRVQFSRKHGSDPGDERRTFEDLNKIIADRIAGAERVARENGQRELRELRRLVSKMAPYLPEHASGPVATLLAEAARLGCEETKG